ncbi:MAG: hypothetical protein GY725_18080 [bacterium]|nr:hypothetical protein [bacterium]
MLKYWILMFVVLGIALYYVFLQDPCNRLVKQNFSAQYPSYTILGSGAEQGSPETVRCRVTYRKPDSPQVFEDLWLYQNIDRRWKFFRVIETREQKATQ